MQSYDNFSIYASFSPFYFCSSVGLAYFALLLLLCGFGDGLVVEIIDHHWWFAMLGAERIVITHIAEAVRLAIRAQLSVPCIFIINWSIYSFIFRW